MIWMKKASDFGFANDVMAIWIGNEKLLENTRKIENCWILNKSKLSKQQILNGSIRKINIQYISSRILQIPRCRYFDNKLNFKYHF